MNLRSLLLFAGFLVACVSAILVGVHATLVNEVEHDYREQLRALLDAKAELAAALTPANLPTDERVRRQLVLDIAKRCSSRVTWIALDGTVLSDSAVNQSAWQQLDNHSTRPEVVAALSGHHGFSLRASSSIGDTEAYVAVPHPSDSGGNGPEINLIVRVSEPAAPDAARRSLLVSLLSGGLLALFLGLGAGLWMAQRYGRTLDELANAAERLLHGEFTVQAKLPKDASVIALKDKLTGVAANLSSTLHALRSERDLLGSILEGMQEGVMVLSKDSEILLVNRALREMWLVPSDVIGHTLLEAFRHAELAEVVALAAESSSKITHELLVSGLKPRKLLLTAAPLAPTSSGEKPHVLLVFVDVTDMRRLESLRRDFVANVSHELKTPVTAVKSAAETLRDGAMSEPEAALTFIDMIERNADRLQSLVEDLLDISRIESRAYEFKLAPVSVHTVVEHAFATFADKAAKKRVRLVNRVPAILQPVLADERALEQVVNNLVDNAVKYCNENTELVVAAKSSGERIQISVKDTSPGIEPQHLPRLFERFYRVDHGRSRDVGGTGLGLSIVKHMTEGMGGSVDVESTLGVGTTFLVSLPRSERST